MAMDIIFYDRSALAERKNNIIPPYLKKHCVWLKHIIYLGKTGCMFGQNSFAALPRGNTTALQEIKQLNRKRVERYLAIYV